MGLVLAGEKKKAAVQGKRSDKGTKVEGRMSPHRSFPLHPCQGTPLARRWSREGLFLQVGVEQRSPEVLKGTAGSFLDLLLSPLPSQLGGDSGGME